MQPKDTKMYNVKENHKTIGGVSDTVRTLGLFWRPFQLIKRLLRPVGSPKKKRSRYASAPFFFCLCCVLCNVKREVIHGFKPDPYPQRWVAAGMAPEIEEGL